MDPFTGRGFTGAKEIILPEYRLIEGQSFRNGDMINVYNRSGEIIKQYGFTKENGWMIVK